jgi:tetratricopeptide (TPR) repeat protein
VSRSAREALLVLLLAVAVYATALPNGFVYDDWDLILNNAWLRSGPFLDVVRLGYWESSRGGSFYYRPVVSLTYWIDHRLWGERPFGYHLTNLLLHGGASLLLLALARRWLPSPRAALAAAAIFAVLPVHTQSVAWIAGRTDLLATFFFLAALLMAQRAVESRSASLHAASFGALALALLSKEMAASYPAALALHASFTGARGDPANGERRGFGWISRRWGPAIAGASAIVAAWLGLRLLIVGRAVGYTDDPHAWWTRASGTASRLLAVPSIVSFYLARVVVPWKLGFESGLHPVHAPGLSQLAPPIAVLLIGGAAVAVLGRREPAILFGALWFLTTLLPVANVFPIFESAMEHFVYLPSAGIVVAGVAIALALARAPAARAALLASVLVLLGARTAIRNLDWRDEETFWKVTTRDTPSARAWNNLGLYLKGAGRLEEAEGALQRVAVDEADLPATWSNLGVVAAARGERQKAIGLFERALAIDPASADALYNLALTLETNARGARYGPGFPAPEAEAVYRSLLAAHPEHAEGWTNLGVLLEVLERPEDAAAAYQHAIDAAPRLAEPYAFLAAVRWRRGDRLGASQLYRRYLDLAPSGELAPEARARLSP